MQKKIFNLFIYNQLLWKKNSIKILLVTKHNLLTKFKKKVLKFKIKKSKIKKTLKTLKKNICNYKKKNIFLKKLFIKNVKTLFIIKKKKFNAIFIKISPINNNIYLNIFFKYKKYKTLFYNSLGVLNIIGKKKRKSNTSIKLLSLSCKIFLKKFFNKIKKKKIKIKNIFFIFPKKIIKVIYYTFLFNIKFYKKYSYKIQKKKKIIKKLFKKFKKRFKKKYILIKKIYKFNYINEFYIKKYNLHSKKTYNRYKKLYKKLIESKFNFFKFYFIDKGLKAHNGCRQKKNRRL